MIITQSAHLHRNDLYLQVAWCNERIASHMLSIERATKSASLLGIGLIGASTLASCAEWASQRHYMQLERLQCLSDTGY